MELKGQDVAPPEAEAMAAAHLPRRRELAALAWQGQEALLGPMALLGPAELLRRGAEEQGAAGLARQRGAMCPQLSSLQG